MFALTRLCEGLIVAHLFLAMAFLVGAAAFPWFEGERDELTAAQGMLRVACTCGLGISVAGVALFALAQLQIFTPYAFGATFVIILMGCGFYWKRSPLRVSYWTVRARVLWEALDGPALLLYYVMLLVAVPCVIPNVGGDPIQFHLAYAQDWANAHGFTVDPYLRFPFYASYFNLFFAALLELHGWAFVNFLTWSTALLTALGLGSACSHLLRASAGRWYPVIAVAITCAVVLSPVFLHWGVTAYMDVQLGAMALLMTLCIEISVWDADPRWLFAAAVLGGYLIGMKSAFILFVPILAFAFFMAARHLSLQRRAAVALFALFVAVSAPWFVRNLVMSGDPVPPVVNIALHGNDGLITKQDWDGIKVDLQSDRSALGVLALPVRAFVNPLTSSFRDYGSSAIILMLYVPSIVLFLMFCAGQKIEPAFSIPVLLLTSFIGYWVFTASHLRYGLSLFPLLGLGCGLCLALLLRRFPRAVPLAACLAILSVLPARDGYQFYLDTAHKNYRFLSILFDDEDVYLRLHDPGYAEEEFIAQYYREHHLNGKVYALGGATTYFFRSHKIESVGDWIGPSGYFRLYHAADQRRTAWFLRDLGVQAVLIEPGFAFGGLDVPLERQLTASGFCKVVIPESAYAFLVDGPCDRRASPT